MAQDDTITQKVKNMYKKYPYPSPSVDTSQTNELLNLLRIFELESNTKLDNLSILDAGCGSGHRITNVAEFFTKCSFLGIDISDKSLEIANGLKAAKKLQNIRFQNHNIMGGVDGLGKFDLVLCMGVLHHLSDPDKGLQMLSKTLSTNGMIFLYLYGKLGGHKRMLNKEAISILLGNEKQNYDLGIKLVRDMGLNKFEYGWNLHFKNEQEEDSLIVDSLLHANEILYDCKDIHKLFEKSNLYGYAIFGITKDINGLLFDTNTNSSKNLSIPQTDMRQFFKNELSLSKYESLGMLEKYRMVDLFFEPNGYTVIGLTKNAFESLSHQRILRNFVKLG